MLERSRAGHFYAVADVNDEPIRFVVDTGATTVALTVEDARRAHVAFDPAAFVVVGRGASGDVRGQEVTLDDVVLDGKRATGLRGLVLEGSDMSLLGQNDLRRMGVEIKGDTMRLRRARVTRAAVVATDDPCGPSFDRCPPGRSSSRRSGSACSR